MALNQRIKSALDPQNILNPGSVFPAERATGIAGPAREG